MAYLLAPSLLAADFSCLGDEIKSIARGGADYLHFDVMDGCFVPNISFGLPVLKSIRPLTALVFDVHLMVSSPEKHIESFAENGADIITVHYETADEKVLGGCLKQIRRLGKKAAVAICPDTPVEGVLPYAGQADMVLIMSVVPGRGGQKLMPDTLKKAAHLADYASRNNIKINIEMDGGINLENLPSVLGAGVNVLVAGSSIFYRGETEARTKKYKEVLTCV